MRSKRIDVYLILLIVFNFLLDIFFYTGYYASDDISYIATLGTFLQENKHLATLRYGVVFPTSAVYLLFGQSFYAAFGFLISVHLALTGLVYHFVKRINTCSNAICAGLLVALTPIYYMYAGTYLPDIIQTLYLFASFYFLWSSFYFQPDIRWIRLLAAGFLFGLAYSAKISAAIMLLPISLFFLYRFRSNVRSLITFYTIFLCGFLSFISFEIFINYISVGELFPQFTLVGDAKDLYLQKMLVDGVHPLDRLTTAKSKLSGIFAESHLLLLLIGLVGSLFSKVKNTLIIWIFMAWPVIYLTFGSTSLSAYLPPSIQARYYAMAIPFLSILVALGLGLIFQMVKQMLLFRIVAILCFFVILFQTVYKNIDHAGLVYRAGQVQTYEKAIDIIRTRNESLPIVLNSYLLRRMHWFPEESKNVTDATLASSTFYYLIPSSRRLHQSDTDDVMRQVGGLSIDVLEVRIIYPTTRMSGILNWLYGLFGSNYPLKNVDRDRGMYLLKMRAVD